jgi:hypothetical protein
VLELILAALIQLQNSDSFAVRNAATATLNAVGRVHDYRPILIKSISDLNHPVEARLRSLDVLDIMNERYKKPPVINTEGTEVDD